MTIDQRAKPPWQAEIEISPELAQELIRAQFPELGPVCARPLGVGWDNTAFLVNEAFVFRFPRRECAWAAIVRENRLLPQIAPRVPLAVPVPLYAGEPSKRFPGPFSGYHILPGRTACAASLTTEQRERAAPVLGRFLRALHSISAEEALAWGAEPDCLGRLDAAKWLPRNRKHLDLLFELQLIADPNRWETILNEAQSMAPVEKLCLVHGDLYVRHLLVDVEGQISGVIDWGDVHFGSAAVDISLIYSFLPPSAHQSFRAAYGAIDPVTSTWARFRALSHSSYLAIFAHDIGDANLLREALGSLNYLVPE